ncbi:uncharacterized protein LOC135808370 [Sycon ciliatum]|uniref:uncharacterized protein LOC135808370 n=1 Tax=Sycon ciliatum TaxID=27933 RepID=UPI0031F68DF5
MDPDFSLDPVALLMRCAPFLSRAQELLSHVTENGWADLAGDFSSLWQHLGSAAHFVHGLYDTDISAAAIAKVAAALLWLEELSMKNPAELLAAFHQFFNTFVSLRSWLKTALMPPGGLSQLLHDNITLELAMYSFGELFIFIIPLINVDKLKTVARVAARFLRMWLLASVRHFVSLARQAKASALSRGRQLRGNQASEDEVDGPSVCVSCRQVPPVAYLANCSHTFCFRCVRTLSSVREDFQCPCCQQAVQYLQPAAAEDP